MTEIDVMKKYVHVLISFIIVFTLFLIENILSPTYLVKSFCKILLFLIGILLYCRISEKSLQEIVNIKRIEKKGLKKLLGTGFFVYFIVLSVYFTVRNYIDLESIKESLLNKENVNINNFIFIFIYIIFVNSLLEEIFFRGFVFTESSKQYPKKFAYAYSGLIFSFYHIGIIVSWFHILIFVLCLVLLFIAALFLNYFNEKYNSCLASWIVHLSANLSINTIGMILMLG